MALIKADFTEGGNGPSIATWSGVSESDTFSSAKFPSKADKTVQFNGNFGSGGCGVEGSLDGTNFHALKDLDGNVITATDDGIFPILENVLFIRPSTPTGTSVSLTITILAK